VGDTFVDVSLAYVDVIVKKAVFLSQNADVEWFYVDAEKAKSPRITALRGLYMVIFERFDVKPAVGRQAFPRFRRIKHNGL